jgi:hypothetical protein
MDWFALLSAKDFRGLKKLGSQKQAIPGPPIEYQTARKVTKRVGRE